MKPFCILALCLLAADVRAADWCNTLESFAWSVFMVSTQEQNPETRKVQYEEAMRSLVNAARKRYGSAWDSSDFESFLATYIEHREMDRSPPHHLSILSTFPSDGQVDIG